MLKQAASLTELSFMKGKEVMLSHNNVQQLH